MQINVRDELPLAEIRQALFEKMNEIEDEYAIRYSRGATLYINPTNGLGEDVVPRNKAGGKVDKLHCNGPYKSAADKYKI